MTTAHQLLPAFTVALLTIIGFLNLAVYRFISVRVRDMKPRFYRAFQGSEEPESVATAARHYNNLFEGPVLFYLLSVTAVLLDAISPATVTLAWIYTIARLGQSAVHMTVNDPRYRAVLFALGWVALIGLWITLATALMAAQ